jgi:hypothetical protein
MSRDLRALGHAAIQLRERSFVTKAAGTIKPRA